jgi:hypothetical protein
MSDLRDSGMESERLRTALEESCDVLVTLEAIRALGADEIAGAEGQMTRAIQSLRRAIIELRQAHDEQVAALALGFVAGSDFSVSELGRSVQPPAHGIDRGGNTAREAEFREDAGDVVLGSAWADV